MISKHPPVNKTEHAHKPAAPLRKAPRKPLTQGHGPGGGTGPPRRKHGHKITELDRFLWAEGEQESSNNYDAVNANSGALGRWQVMPSNLPGWLKESGQPQMSDDAFLANHKAQNAVAYTILGGYYKQYGPAGAAAMWYSGQPDPTKTYGDPPVYQYVDDVLALMNSPNVGPVADTGTATVMPWLAPKVSSTDSWSGQVKGAAAKFAEAGGHAGRYASLIHDARARVDR